MLTAVLLNEYFKEKIWTEKKKSFNSYAFNRYTEY